MKKRVGLARTLALQPEVILYDEPTTGLDPVNTARINHLINGIQRALKITSVVVTHDMGTAFSVSDRLVMIGRGRIAPGGHQGRVQEHPQPDRARLHRRAGARDRGRRRSSRFFLRTRMKRQVKVGLFVISASRSPWPASCSSAAPSCSGTPASSTGPPSPTSWG